MRLIHYARLMLDKPKNFFATLNKQLTKIRDLERPRQYILIAIVLLIAILGLSKILQPLELAIYDLNFWLRPRELTDERIVIVEWDERSIQMLEETIISDRTISDLLNKIAQQQPRIIGLDLYRDIPVHSPRLNDAQNIQAYNSLRQFFSKTNNLIGIEKVVKPIINPPLVLKEKEQTAASDIDRDRDDVVRRAYIFPQLDVNGSPAGIPYLGVALGYQYLEAQGWTAEKLKDHSLMITNGLDRVKVKPLQAKTSDPFGLDMLVNWRKGDPNFKQVSVTEVISNQIPPDLFYDRIVLIGNVSASTADRHNTPLDRGSSSWTYGVQIPAQVASSIVSAALDNRPLMQAVGTEIEWSIVIIFTLFTIAIANYHLSNESKNLYLTTSLCALGLTAILVVFNFAAFRLGWWVPITTAIGAIWLTYFALNYYFSRERERKNALELEMFVRDLQHSLGNILNSIASSTNRIQVSTESLEDDLASGIPSEAIDNVRTPTCESHTRIIRKKTDNIARQISRMERYRKRTEEFIDFSYLSKTNTQKITEINQFVSSIVTRFEQENDYDYQVNVRQVYDIRLHCIKIDRAAIEIVLENLLDNAFYSVAPIKNKQREYLPLVKVQTKLNKTTVEFSVEDNGKGIPKNLHQKIFQPFVSFNYGQGIGLYLSKKILSLYRGKIKVESLEGQGCKFTFTIPYTVDRHAK